MQTDVFTETMSVTQNKKKGKEMKKAILFIITIIFTFVLTLDISKVKASGTTHDASIMLLSIEDIIIANELANGDEDLLVETIAQIGYDNYIEGSATEVDDAFIIFGQRITYTETMLLLDNPQLVPFWTYCALKAMDKTDELYPAAEDGSKGNSFQHAYWNVLMAKYMTSIFAAAFANAHEDYSPNYYMHKNMDLYNNSQGRILANSISLILLLDDDLLAEITQSLVSEGNLKYILWNHSYVHTRIYYDNNIIVDVYEDGNFYAYTNKNVPIHLPDPIIDDRRTDPGPIIMGMTDE